MTRQIVVTAPKQVAFQEIQDPPLGQGQLRIESQFLGISIGTELNTYRAGVNWHTGRDPDTRLFMPGQNAWEYPATLGYGNVGKVVEVASDVTHFNTGDLVYSLAGHATRTVQPASRVWHVPDNANPKPFVFLQLIKTALGVVLHARPALGETVTIFGAGVVGLLIIQLLKRNGVSRIILFEPIASRRELALKMGADIALDPIKVDAGQAVREMNQGKGTDIAIEASGNQAAVQQCARVLEPQGRVVLAAMYPRPIEIHLGQETHFNCVQYVAAHVMRLPRDMHPIWTLDRRDAFARDLIPLLDLESLITHEYDFDEAPDVYQMLDNNPTDVISVVLRCQPSST